MNRLTKKAEEERKAFKPYESKYKTGLHIRLTEFLMLDENYLSLSNDAKVLYSYMRLWAYRSKEFRETGIVKFSISLAMKMCRVSKNTAIKCFSELETKKFIARQNNSRASRETTQWAFIDSWWADSEP